MPQTSRIDWIQTPIEITMRWKHLLKLEGPSEFHPGTQLFAQGSDPREMFLIEQGLIKLTCTQADGTNSIVQLRCPGQWVETSAALLEEQYPVTATALTRSDIFRFDARRFREQINTLEVANLLILQQTIDLAEAGAVVAGLKSSDAKRRFVEFLEWLSRHTGVRRGDRMERVQIPLKDHEVAELIGISKQHLSVVKRAMLACGELAQDGAFYTLRARVSKPSFRFTRP